MSDIESGNVSDSFPLPVGPATPVAYLTIAERAERGLAARAHAPRSSSAAWAPSAQRPDPVELLEAQAKARVAELMPIRYGRMLSSPLAFLRGAAIVMASDVASIPRSGLDVQLCGDAHLSNFGTFVSPEGQLVFNVNDFDETLPGPFEWDLRRLVTSFAVAGRMLGYDAGQRRLVTCQVGRSYRESMSDLANMCNLDVWSARVDVAETRERTTSQVSTRVFRRAGRGIAVAHPKDSLAAFEKLTYLANGERRIIANPPLVVPIRDLGAGDVGLEAVNAAFHSYRRTLSSSRRHLLERFRLVDAARKVVGVGSAGDRDWIVLLLGRDTDDPLFLQIKEANASVLEPFLGRSRFGSHGQRVVDGQRLMQGESDLFLGWFKTIGLDGVERDYYVRHLWDSKGAAMIDAMAPKTMIAYAQVCGWALALGHARSGDAIAIASYLGTSETFDNALAAFAETYADQNQLDYDALVAAADSGRIKAQRDL